MKKKVLYGVAMTFLACASVGTLQSCKDDMSDFTHQYKYDRDGLLKRVGDLENAVSACKENCGKEIEQLKEKIKTNADNITNLDSDLKELAGKLANYVTYEKLEEQLATLKADSKDYTDAQIATAVAAINANIDGVKGDLANLSTSVSGLSTTVSEINAAVEGLNTSVAGLTDKVGANETALAAINTTLATYDAAIRTINGNLSILEAQVLGHAEEIEGLKLQFEEVGAQIEEVWLAVQQNQEFMTQMYKSLMTEIEDKFNELTNRMDNLITSLVVQGTDCPIFGNFSLPLGIQSNMLFNWYGYNDIEKYEFPNAGSEYNYNPDKAPVLSQTEIDALAPELATVPKGYYGDVNLGKLYLTINPVGHSFDENAFKLETTAGNAFPATLNVSKSNDEMYFGYHKSRAAVEGNGFYAAEVIVEKNNISTAELKIEDGLKSSVKAALDDPSKRTAVELLKGIYTQLNGSLPAYAIRYDWTANDKAYSVLSNYAVAATTAKPLSYSFLRDKGTSKHLRKFGHVSNFVASLKNKVLDKFNINTAIKVVGHDVILKDISFGENSDNGQIMATVDLMVDSKSYTLTPDLGMDPKEAVANLSSAIADWFIVEFDVTEDAQKAEVEMKLDASLLEVQKQLAEVAEDIKGSIDSVFDDLEDKGEPYFKRLDKLVDLYNKVAGKINNFLANPNHYLQVAMFYNQTDSQVGILSTSLSSPTYFKNGNGWIALYASSYTGEIVAPAYMKYVAITNVYDAKTKKSLNPSASDLKTLNAKGQYLNEVMTGNTLRFGISASSLESGKIYEIAYQGVDYNGRTSTQKFYIQVK